MGAQVSSVRAIDNDIETTHRKQMQELADRIVSLPPSWLPELLSDWSFEISSRKSIEDIQPTRADLWKSIARVEVLAIDLCDSLKVPFVEGFISEGSAPEFEGSLADGILFLKKLAAAARAARNSPELAKVNGKHRPGRNKPRLPNIMAPKFACAAVVTEILTHFHGDQASLPTDHFCWTVADQLWRTWFNDEGWGTDPSKGCKRYFQSVDDPRLRSLRDEVRRHLKIRSSEAQSVLEKNKT